MLLDKYVRDYRGFMADFIASLQSNETFLYLDTSFLIWLIRLGSEARSEALAWLQRRPSQSVRIPVWTAHELHRHIIAGTAKKNLLEAVADASSKINDFVRIAAERADNNSCTSHGYADKTSYLSELHLSVMKFDQLAKVVQLDNPSLQAATQEVIDFVNAHVLSTDLAPTLEKLSSVAALRTGHYIPPGFQDKKPDNSFGDLFIWNEIVADLKVISSESGALERDVIFISRDRKTDWVSAAPFVIDLRGNLVTGNRDLELDVTLPHPFLIHELHGAARCKRLYIAQPSLVSSALYSAAIHEGEQNTFQNWFSASHPPMVVEKLAPLSLARAAATEETRPSSAGQAPSQTQEVVPAALTLDATDVRDLAMDTQSEVRAFLEALPIEQEQLLASWQEMVQSNSLSAIKFGRVLSELVAARIGNLQERTPAILGDLARNAGANTANLAALAFISTAYFDRYSELRSAPEPVVGSVVITLELEPVLAPAFSALNRFLKDSDAELPYVPGSGRSQPPFKLDLAEGPAGAPRAIRDIRIAGQSVLANPSSEDNPRSLSRLLESSSTEGCAAKKLRLLLAREYLIPADLIDSRQDKLKITWDPGSCLVTLDLASPGGFSTSADEEIE